MKLVRLATIVLTLCISATAQTAWNQTAYTNKATSGFSSTFRNVNQSSHWLSFCSGSGVTSGTIEIDGSADNSHWVTISNIGVLFPNQCGVIQGGGYYPYVIAQIKSFVGATPGVTATYSASVGPVTLPANTGFAVTTTPTTMVPALASTFSAVKSTGVQVSPITNTVFYGVNVYNPNSGTVFVALGNSTPFVGGGSGVWMVPVAAGQAVSVYMPPQGVGLSNNGGLYVGCSTSSTSAVDPTSNCIVSVVWKVASLGNAVPN